MRLRNNLLVIVASVVFCAVAYAQEPSARGRFNGLNMNLGNLYRLSNAQTRSISPENFTGEKGKAGMATEGTGANCARGTRPGLEDLPLGRHQGQIDFHDGRDRRTGGDPADLDDAGPDQ